MANGLLMKKAVIVNPDAKIFFHSSVIANNRAEVGNKNLLSLQTCMCNGTPTAPRKILGFYDRTLLVLPGEGIMREKNSLFCPSTGLELRINRKIKPQIKKVQSGEIALRLRGIIAAPDFEQNRTIIFDSKVLQTIAFGKGCNWKMAYCAVSEDYKTMEIVNKDKWDSLTEICMHKIISPKKGGIFPVIRNLRPRDVFDNPFKFCLTAQDGNALEQRHSLMILGDGKGFGFEYNTLAGAALIEGRQMVSNILGRSGLLED